MNFWLLLLAVPAAALSVGLTVIIIKTIVDSFKEK